MSGEATTHVITDSGDDIGPGQRLREAREAAHLSAAEVASRMRLEPHIIERLENDEYDRLHGPTFVRGYLSGYARLLNLPERPILEAYERHGFGPPALVSELGAKTEVHVSDFPVRMTTYVIAGLLVVLVVMWWQSRQAPTNHPEVVMQGDVTGTTRPVVDSAAVETAPAAPAAPSAESGSNAPGLPESPEGAVGSDPAPQASPPGESAGAAATMPSALAPAGPAPAPAPAPTIPGGADVEAQQAVAGIAASGPAPDSRPETILDAGEATAGVDNDGGAGTEGQTPATTTRPDGAAEQIAAIIDGAGETASAASTSKAMGPVAPPARPEPLPGSDVLAIRLKRESWIEVYDRGGGRLYYSLAREGSEVVVTGAGPMRVLLGDVEGAAVAYNGEPYDLSRYAGRSVVRFTVGEDASATKHPTRPAAPANDAPATAEPSEPTARTDSLSPQARPDRGAERWPTVTTWGPPPASRPSPPGLAGPRRDS